MTATGQSESRQGRYVRANGLDMYYEEQGQGRPLVLIHGGALTGASWQPYLAGLAQHYQVITPDSRGHGQTKNPAGNLSFGLLADDVAALAEALDLRKPVICGYSDGGQVALEVGMRYPELPQAIVIGGAYVELTEASSEWVRSILGDEASPEVDFENLERADPDFVAMLNHVQGPEAWKTLMQQIKPMWNAKLNYTPDDFAKVVAPTLVVVGDRDGFVPVEEGVRMYRLLPNAEFAVVPGADHIQLIVSPEKVALAQPLILDFLRRHGGSGEQGEAS